MHNFLAIQNLSMLIFVGIAMPTYENSVQAHLNIVISNLFRNPFNNQYLSIITFAKLLIGKDSESSSE